MANTFEDDKPDLSRRKFGRSATLGVAAAFATGRIYASHGPQQEGPSTKQSSEAPSAYKIGPKETEQVEARFQRVMQQYGERLSPEQKTRIRKILTFNEKLLEPICSYPLENGQAPATEFKVYAAAAEKLRKEKS